MESFFFNITDTSYKMKYLFYKDDVNYLKRVDISNGIVCVNMVFDLHQDRNYKFLLYKKDVYKYERGQTYHYPIEMLYTTYYPRFFFLGVDEVLICNALQKDIHLAKILDCFESN